MPEIYQSMTQKLPAQEQIADWISQIEPNDYFEQNASVSEVLLLRVKSPRSQYQGIHFGLSRKARDEMARLVEELQPRHDKCSCTLAGSYPAGRAWFNLYGSDLDVGTWASITMSLAPDLDVQGEIEWKNHHVIFRLSDEGRATFCQALREADTSPLQIVLPIRRLAKPESEPHSCWIWEWEPSKHTARRG